MHEVLQCKNLQGRVEPDVQVEPALQPITGEELARGTNQESVKGSGNSAFLQNNQLCYLKRAEKLTFSIYFSKNKMQNCYLFVNAS